MEYQENKMGTHKILPLLISMSVPPTISMMINSMYNIVDSVFVASLGTDALTAVSLAFPIQNLILAIAVGSGVGVNSYVARKLGERNQLEADSTAAHGIILAILHYILLCTLGFIFIRPFFQMFTNNNEILKMGYNYTYIVTFLSFGTIIQIAIEKILQATGDTVSPMVLQIIGAVANIILDPIMIYGYFGFPAMGVSGAALATICGQLISLICSLYVLYFRNKDIKADLFNFRWNKNTVKEIYNVGIPSFFIMSIGSFLVMGINFILAGISDIAVSVFGIYFKLQTFVYMPTTGVTQGAMPIMAYNYGAKSKKRLSESLKYSIIICVIVNFLGSILFWIFPEKILSLFDASDEMINLGVQVLKIISLGYSFGSVCYIVSSFLQTIGKGIPSLAITLLRQIILLLPAAYFMGKYFGLAGVWAAFPIVEVITCILCFFMYKNFAKKDALLA